MYDIGDDIRSLLKLFADDALLYKGNTLQYR